MKVTSTFTELQTFLWKTYVETLCSMYNYRKWSFVIGTMIMRLIRAMLRNGRFQCISGSVHKNLRIALWGEGRD